MLYFDNAATGGRKPDAVLTAVLASLRLCANPGRSGHRRSLTCAQTVQRCRNELNDFFDGYGYERVAFTKNCTEALNIALFSTLKAGDHAVCTCLEHNSVLRPLEFLRRTKGVEYDVCPLEKDGNISAERFSSLVKANTKLAIVTSASNVTGTIPPILDIRKQLSKKVLLLCDGAQGAGHFPLSMHDSGVDMLALAGHKGLFGIQGSGALLFSERVELSPLLYGGTGSMSLSLDMPDFYPDALEAGTLSYPAVLSLLEGVRHLRVHGTEIARRCFLLSERFCEGLEKIKSYELFSKPNPCGIVAFRHALLPSERIAELLSSKYDIAVRGGLHCAPLAHEHLGTLDGGLVRVSFSPFNLLSEVGTLLDAISSVAKGQDAL